MKWISKLFKKKEIKVKSENNEIDLDTFIKILENKINLKNSDLEKNFKKIHDKILESSKEFQKSIEEFKKSKGPNKIDSRLKDVVYSYRESFIKNFNIVFIEFNRPVNYTIIDFRNYFNKCLEILDKTENSVTKFIKPLNEIFSKSMINVNNKSKKLNNIIRNVSVDLEDNTKEINPFIDSLKIAKQFNYILINVSNTEKELKYYEIDLKQNISDKEKLYNKISNFKNNEEWISFNNNKKEFDIIEQKKSDVKYVFLQNISSFEKSMKKFKKLILDGKEYFEYSNLLDFYIKDPISAFLEDSSQIAIKNIFLKIKNLAEYAKLGLDDRSNKKVLDKLISINYGNIIIELRKDYSELEENQKNLLEKMKSSDVISIKNKYTEELKNIEHKIIEKENKIEKVKIQLEKLNKEKKNIFDSLKKTEYKVMEEGTKLKDL